MAFLSNAQGRARKGLATIEAKTSNYTVTAADNGKIFTTRGAVGAVIFTLPAVTAVPIGFTVAFYCLADQNMTVAATAGQLTALTDLAANSVALSTAAERAGGSFEVINDGTAWLVLPHCWTDVGGVTQTITVAT